MSPSDFAAQPWVERLGWTLLHFLWQGALIASLYAAVRTRLRDRSPQLRYVAACVALLLLTAAPLATWMLHGAADSLPLSARPSNPSPYPSPASPAMLAPPFPEQPVVPVLPVVVAIWLGGSIVLCLRLFGGWVFALRLRNRHTSAAPQEWQDAVRRLADRVRVSRPVRLLASSTIRVPIVTGWLRPVILIPAGALAGLPAEHLEALLLHELAHVRRADFLVNLFQSLTEALLFYHPAVWWISAHIRAEREACCDDIAVAATGDVLVYARALAEMESSRSLLPQAALAANGGSLTARIARLLGEPHRPSRRLPGGESAAAGLLLAAVAVALYAQPAPRPKFEVASIKPAPDQGFMMIRPTGGGRLTASAPLLMLIQASHSLQAFQIIGAPDWAQSERYSIEAKGAGNPGQAELMLMLQTLLEERFELKSHRETKDLPAYALVATKSGARLTPPKEGGCRVLDPTAPTPPPAPGTPQLMPCGFVRTMMSPNGMKMNGSKVTMTELARVLSMTLGRPVADKTAITAPFDLELEFAPDPSLAGLPGRPPGMEPSADNNRATIFSALQEQLGLRLESAKTPVEVMVIDHVARPTAN